MKIKFAIDEAAALRRGVDVPGATVVLDVDPQTLSDERRQVLAAVAVRLPGQDALDATILGLQTEPEGIVGEQYRISYSHGGTVPEVTRWANGRPRGSLVLHGPTQSDLVDAIDRLLALQRTEHAALAAEASKRQQAADAKIRELLAAERTEDLMLGLDAAGARATYGRVVQCTITVPEVPYSGDAGRASPEVRAQYDLARDEAQARRDELVEAAMPSLRGELAAELGRRQAERDRQKAEYDALYARLPEALRERHEAGYASSTEVSRAIRRLLRADAGYGEGAVTGYDQLRAKPHLSDDEYRALRAIETEAPEGAEVTTHEALWMVDTPCDYHEEMAGEVDGNCDECTSETTRAQSVARVHWTRGGVTVVATRPL